PGKWAYCINYDKIQNKREKSGKPRQIIRFEDEIPNVTQGKLLNTIVSKSVELVPRNYVLTAVRTKKPMGVSSYDAALREIFKPRQPRQNLIRKAYVNYWYRKELPMSSLKEIADRMRHTTTVALGSYRKIGLDEIKEPPPAPVEEKVPLIPEVKSLPIVQPAEVKELPIVAPAEPPALPVLPPRAKYNPVEYSRQYREAHKEQIDKKRREEYDRNKDKILAAKILFNLTRGFSTRPTKRSIEKYGLFQDPTTGKWKSSEQSPDEEPM